MERWLQQEGYPEVDRDMTFLRRLQQLRSRMVAHRKGSDYEDFVAAQGIDEDPIREIVVQLMSACKTFEALALHFDVDLNRI